MNVKPIAYLHPEYKKIPDLGVFFETIKNTYPQVKKNGIYVKDEDKSIYIYKIKSKSNTYLGLLAGVDINDYLKGLIKKHEHTLIAQENNMSNLIRERDAMIKPVLLAYPQRKKIKELMLKVVNTRKADYTIYFEKDRQYHEFYKMTDSKWIKSLQKEFNKKVACSYIADGHHRMAAISDIIRQQPDIQKKSLQHIFCALFDFNELDILPYNRIINILDKYNLDDILYRFSRIARVGELKKYRNPEKKHEVVMMVGDSQFSIKWKKEIVDYFKLKNKIAFDVDIFNKVILHDMFEITDIRSDTRIQYIEGNKNVNQLKKMVVENPKGIGFIFYPIKRLEFTKVADANMVLPPKSTWFEPRIRNGIIVQQLNLQ